MVTYMNERLYTIYVVVFLTIDSLPTHYSFNTNFNIVLTIIHTRKQTNTFTVHCSRMCFKINIQIKY